MRRRFFVEDFSEATALLRGEAADHLGRVLRAEPGQLYELSDGRRVWLAKIERVAIAKRSQSRIEFALIEPVPASEPVLRINLLISIVKFDRFEWCLEKATELGANEIVPVAAARTDKPLIAAAAKRRERWQKILLESAQQSRRLRPPVLHEIGTPEQAFRKYPRGLKILLSERPEAAVVPYTCRHFRRSRPRLQHGRGDSGWGRTSWAKGPSFRRSRHRTGRRVDRRGNSRPLGSRIRGSFAREKHPSH